MGTMEGKGKVANGKATKSSYNMFMILVTAVSVAMASVCWWDRLMGYSGSMNNNGDSVACVRTLAASMGLGSAPLTTDIELSVAAEATVYGEVPKKSVLPIHLVGHGDEILEQRMESLTQWITNHDVKMEPVPSGVVPFTCGGIAINHKYRLLYIRQLKSGSTAIMHFFGNCKTTDSPTCLYEPKTKLPDEELRQYLRDYTVFTFVRNPYTRAASAFSYLNYVVRASRIDSEDFAKPHCKVEWPDYCVNPRILGRHCRQFPACCAHTRITTLVRHTEPQYRCTVGEDGTWAVDFIGRVENSNEDMQALVRFINRRLPPGVDPLVEPETLEHPNVQSCDAEGTSKRKKTEEELADCEPEDKYAKYYTQNPECFQGVKNYYSEDLKYLGFPY